MINSQEHLDNLITAAYYREIEIYNYQVNIDNYQLIIESFAHTEWPENLIQYRKIPIIELPVDLPEQYVDTINDLQYYDRMKELLRTEKSEQSKSIRILDVLKKQIGNDYDSLIQTKKTQLQNNV